MLSFTILKKSKKSGARAGVLKTAHGEVETPTLVPVATAASVKTLSSEEVLQTKTQILISNTFHLHTKGADKLIKSSGGLHKFMSWPKPLMTDSGGFQVFSLGFGKDFGVGKIIKHNTNLRMRANDTNSMRIARYERAHTNINEVVGFNQQPKHVKITAEGVRFRSPINGDELFLGPRESIKIQEAIGADIIFSFDECPPPLADYAYNKQAIARTHEWAKICLKTKKSRQALFGIVQGGKYKDLRIESARFIGGLPFDGFGIGGEFGAEKKTMEQMIGWVNQNLPEEKPRHLLGIGYPEDIPKIIKKGVDTFDCIVPTHYARRGFAFTSAGRLDLGKAVFLKDKKPLDANCECRICQNYRRNYICHLERTKEITAMNLLTFHNLYFFNSFIEKIRKDIKNGKF
ncbi:MAG TPA: tRNA guanosine(34) transglycosylase Tgt [Candidatus Paceibacterota bacterium]